MGKSHSKLSQEEIAKLQKNTSFNQEELKTWYKKFMHDYPSGRLSKEQFQDFHERFFPSGDPSEFVGYFFEAFDTDHNGNINFTEFISPLSLISQGDPDKKLRWVFDLYDMNQDGTIAHIEMLKIVRSVYKMVGPMVEHAEDENTPEKRVIKIFASMDIDHDSRITYEEFVDGSKRDPAIVKALSLYDGLV